MNLTLSHQQKTIFSLAVDTIKKESAVSFYRCFKLMVYCNTNNYAFSFYARNKLIKMGYNENIVDCRNMKLFRKSLADFIKKGKIASTE